MIKKLRVLVILVTVLFSTKVFAQVDKHIDPSAKKHKQTLSISKHTSTTFTLAKAVSSFTSGTKILQTCDNKINDNQDVACQVTVQAGSTLGSFGAASDGLDIINTQAELDAVMNNNTAFIKVVTDIPGNGSTLCGAASGPILACANTPGSTIVIISGMTIDEWGTVIIHEFGHSKGLGHRNSPGDPIMHPNPIGKKEVNDTEAAAFHVGGAEDGDNKPVDVLFLIDDTGSMTEEIQGVKNSVTAAIDNIALSVSSCGKVYQLVSFKDGINFSGDPTTDLNQIKAQVAALVASGGGDCPEGSVESLNIAKEKVKNNGVIFFASDADPHPGTNIEAAKTGLVSRSIQFTTLLSGACTNSPTPFSATQGSPDNVIPYSNNNDSTQGTTTVSTSSISANPNSIEAYSYLSEQTGGSFVFFPDINTISDPSNAILYQNIGYNVILGSFFPTVTYLEPYRAPVGSIIALTIKSSKTNFNASTVLSFNSPGITVQNITLVSPTKLLATISIAGSEPLGFKDITALTTLADGTIENAQGVGLFEVRLAPTTPTVLSISPSSGKAGETLNVIITGINTSFASSSVLNIGAGITILNQTPVSGQELQATIKINPTAAIGYRSITITTGTEIATENVIGPFLVIANDCALPPVANGITASSADAFCNTLQLSASYTAGSNGDPVSYEWSFAGTPVFGNSGSINLSTVNPDGEYSVIVRDANGCASLPVSYNYQSQNLLSTYVIYALQKAKIGEKNTINGSIGVKSAYGRAEFKRYTTIPAPNFVKAKTINVSNPVTIPNRITSAATNVTLPTLFTFSGNIFGLPSYTAPQSSVRTFGNAREILVKKYATVTLTGTLYGKIEIGKGAKVTFTKSNVNVKEMYSDNADISKPTNVYFSQDTKMMVERNIWLGKSSVVNPDNRKVTFYVGPVYCTQEKFFVNGENSSITANVYIPQGVLKVLGCDNLNCRMTGTFIAEQIESEGQNIIWNGYDCNPVPTPFARGIYTQTDQNFSEVNAKNNKVITPEVFEINVAPNPSQSDFRLSITSQTNSDVSMRVSDAFGRLMEAKNNILPNSNFSVGNSFPAGIYYAEFIQNGVRKMVKLIKLF